MSWKHALRLGVAALLVAGVVWIVPWRDHVVWPSRYGATPLAGRLEPSTAGSRDESPRFLVEEGEHRGESLEFLTLAGAAASEPSATRWSTVVVRRPDGGEQRLALTDSEQRELEKQPEAGLLTTFRRLRREPLAVVLALLLYVAAAMLSFQRWEVLLHAVHVDARFARVQKLGFLGLFFSNIIPGMTGGDLVKAILVARDHPEQRPAAVLSVIVDRAIGLLGLALVASAVLLFQPGRFESTKLELNTILGAILLAGGVVMSRRLRRGIKLDKLLSALPFAEVLKKLDRSALLYRNARWQLAYAIGVSLVVHGMILTAIGLLGRALGLHIHFVDYYALAPLALIAQSLPVTPGGVGVGEAAFIYFFSMAGVPRAGALALSVSYRVVQLVVSLVGGILMVTRHERPVSAREMEASSSEAGELGGKDLDDDARTRASEAPAR